MKTKYLVTIEFRYEKLNKYNDDLTSANNTITIGVFDTFEQASKEGNKQLEILEDKFKLNPNWNTKERFSLNGGCFGSKRNLITNLAYLQTPFAFFAKIDTLYYNDVNATIENALKDIKEVKKFKQSNPDY